MLDQIPSCALDHTGRREQAARYARLGPSITNARRESEALLIEFNPGFDRRTLDEALAVERECCPFFRFAFEEEPPSLRVTVAQAEMLPALEAIAYALGLAPA
ncbi:MAG TPA: hypothetical protein VIJ20_12760 [Solirubrobacteraceae bacterium]